MKRLWAVLVFVSSVFAQEFLMFGVEVYPHGSEGRKTAYPLRSSVIVKASIPLYLSPDDEEPVDILPRNSSVVILTSVASDKSGAYFYVVKTSEGVFFAPVQYFYFMDGWE